MYEYLRSTKSSANMSPDQIQSVRSMAGFTRKEWSVFSGISDIRLRYWEEPEYTIIRLGPEPSKEFIPRWVAFAYGWIALNGLDIPPGFDAVEQFVKFKKLRKLSAVDLGDMLGVSYKTTTNWVSGPHGRPKLFPYMVLWLAIHGDKNIFETEAA